MRIDLFRPLTAAALLLLAAPAARAQDVPEPPPATPDAPEARDCRCVDEDGQEIEECVCMRMPHMDHAMHMEHMRHMEDMPRMRRMAPMPPMAFRMFRDADGERASFRAGPRLGVALEPAGGDGGAVVADVVEDSPAEEAGLRTGDVITHFAGAALFQPIEGEEDERSIREAEETERPVRRLITLVRRQDPGDTVAVRYVRDGTSREALAVLDDRGRRGGFAMPRIEIDGEEIRARMEEFEEEMEARMPEIQRRMEEAMGRMGEAMERMGEAMQRMRRIEIRDDSLFLFRGDSLVEARPFEADSAFEGVYRGHPEGAEIHFREGAPHPPRERPARPERPTRTDRRDT